MAEAMKATITKLNRSNYQAWRFKMELVLLETDLWEVVTRPPPHPVTDEWTKKDGKARSKIGLLIEDSQLQYVRKVRTAKEMWEALETQHQRGTLSNTVSLYKRLFHSKFEKGSDLEGHLNQIEDTADLLASLGETVNERVVAIAMLASLPEEFNVLATALEARPDTDICIQLVKLKILEEFDRFTSNEVNFHRGEKVLKVKTSTIKGQCFWCKREGHFKKQCKKYLDWKRRNAHSAKVTVSGSSNEDIAVQSGAEEVTYRSFSAMEVTEIQDTASPESHSCLMSSTWSVAQDVNQWYVDSGASTHMCESEAFFEHLDKGNLKTVRVADGRTVVATGIGSGTLCCSMNGEPVHRLKLTGVLHVPDLDGNLLSVKRLNEDGYDVHFKGPDLSCSILQGGVPIAEAFLDSALYVLRQEKVFHTECDRSRECIHMWHARCGHRDPEVLNRLRNNNTVDGLHLAPCCRKQHCEICIKGKMQRSPFPKKSKHESKEILQLVHSDVCGPIQTQSLGGNRYILTLIDDHSGYTKVYLLKTKAEVPDRIMDYVNLVENQQKTRVKCIRSDRGKEYVNHRLQTALQERGIKTQYTAPYSPQQNGKAERKNRTLFDMARCMLLGSGLPNSFWGEAVMTANHVLNRLPEKGNSVTPYERWHGQKPNIKYFRPFGCTAYVHIPKELRRKLDKRADKLLFVGYQEGSKAYRFLNPVTKQVRISRDAVFLEGNPHIQQLEVETPRVLNHEKEIDKEVCVEFNDSDILDMENNSQIRRSQRVTKGRPPERLIRSMKSTSEEVEPKTYTEAVSCANSDKWIDAMDKEMDVLKENGTWILCEAPSDANVIGNKWVYKIKRDSNGNPVKYKARLVAQGFSQKYGTDYNEVFAPVVRPTTIKMLLSVAGRKDFHVKHYDIESAYLNGDLEHTVYMQQPVGYVSEDRRVCKLVKNLYGLKQGASQWNRKLDTVLRSNVFSQSNHDPCLYWKKFKDEWIYIVVHVDYVIGVCKYIEGLVSFEQDLGKEFKLKDLGMLTHCLGLSYERDDEGNFFVHQSHYIEEKLKEFGLCEARHSAIPLDPGYLRRCEVQVPMKDTHVYARAIGSLLYLSSNSRPDISVAVSILAREMREPCESSWNEVKRVFRYLSGTRDLRLRLSDKASDTEGCLWGYADADWGGDTRERKSNSGYCFSFLGGMVNWTSRRQASITLSSTEAEYIALCDASQEAVWLRGLAEELHMPIGQIVLREDNQSCIRLLQNNQISQRTKHIDIKYHFVRNMVKQGMIDVIYCPTAEMVADILTKPLEAVKFRRCVEGLGLVNR